MPIDLWQIVIAATKKESTQNGDRVRDRHTHVAHMQDLDFRESVCGAYDLCFTNLYGEAIISLETSIWWIKDKFYRSQNHNFWS